MNQKRSIRRMTALGLLALGTAVLVSDRIQAYVLNGQSWTKNPVTYYVNPANSQGLSSSAVIAAVQTAASAWSQQTQANISLWYGGTTNVSTVQYDGVNAVMFRSDSGPFAYTTYWFDGSNHILDSDTQIYQGTATYYTGSAGCTGSGAYIEDVMTHEFGHSLGMGHSGLTSATMYASANYCTTDLRSLDPDDISGIQAIYPPSNNTAPTAPSQLVVATNASNPTSALSLGWVNTATNASGYRVNRSADGVNFAQVAQLGSSASSYADSGLASGATYYYQVYAYNSAGTAASNMAFGQTQALSTAPAAPSNPSPSNGATGVSTSATLTWTCSGATSYDVYINGSLYAANRTSASVPTTLSASTQYSWYVVAKNSVGSTPGPTWSFTTKAAAVVKGKGRAK